MTHPLTDKSRIDFGKYEGEELGKIPAQYLLWLHENNKCHSRLRDYIDDNLDALRAENGDRSGVRIKK